MEIATWRTKTLEVSPERIMAFSTLSYTAELNTKEKKASKETYVQLKAAKPKTISFDMKLMENLGVDVETEIDDWVALSKDGKSEKFYLAGSPLGTCKYLLESAKATEVRVDGSGAITEATLALSFKQASKDESTKKKKKKKKKKPAKKPSASATRQRVRHVNLVADVSRRSSRPPGLGITIR